MKGQDDEQLITDLIHRCQTYVYPRRIRVREFFLNFDPLRSGRVTRVQFGRGLNTSGVKFTDYEVEILSDHFTERGPNVQKPQVVSYVKFCQAVDEIFASDIEIGSTQDGREDPMSSMLRMSMTSFIPKAVDSHMEERVDHVMHRLAALCKSRGIVFKYLWFDYDRGPSPSPSRMNPVRAGKCSANQFRRVFVMTFPKEFPSDDIELLIHRFSTDGGDVHFQAIHNEISEVLSPEPPEFPTSPLYLKPDPTAWAHQTLDPVKKVLSIVVAKRIRLRDFFKDFDGLRKGFCTAGQLKTVLTISDLSKDVNKTDFAHLLQNYSRDDGMFCYAAFVRDIDAAFGVPGLEKNPLMMTPLPDATTTAPGRRNRMSMTSHMKQEFFKLEEKIRARIRKRRILMKPSFQDMDKAHKGLVSKSRFQRVMGTLGFELTPDEIQLLANVYCDRGNHNEFNYVDFIKANDPPIEHEEIAMAQLNAPYQDEAASKYFNGLKVHPLDRSVSSPALIGLAC
jgi:Ca2+-binding EF-hand superfamily protein